MGFIFLALFITPIVELWFLIQVGAWLGVFPTVLVVALTAVWGAFLARREGLRALQNYQASLLRGELPADALVDTLAIFVGGALLLTPGFFTDAFGFALLLEPSRRLFKHVLLKWTKKRIETGHIFVQTQGFSQQSSASKPVQGEIIDQEFDD